MKKLALMLAVAGLAACQADTPPAETTADVAADVPSPAAAMNDIAEGEGDLTRRLEVQGRDEIAMLAEAFNKFAGKVHGVVSEVMNSVRQLNSAASTLSMITSETSTGRITI